MGKNITTVLIKCLSGKAFMPPYFFLRTPPVFLPHILEKENHKVECRFQFFFKCPRAGTI